MKLLIAGYGYVGKAHYNHFQRHYELEIADPAINQKSTKDLVNGVSGVICCVSTPESSNGDCDMTNVFNVVEETPTEIPIIIRSTISIQGWDELKNKFPNHNITFCPEFLRAATADGDFVINQTLHMGGSGVQFWHDIYIKVLTHLKVGEVDPKVLIAGKCLRNSFLALKVSFFNQIFDYCTAENIDYDLVAQMVAVDPRIGGSHTSISKERGFGGHCFPKDTRAMVKSADKVGVDFSILREAIEYNNKIRAPKANK